MGAKSGSKATRLAKQNGGKGGKSAEPKESPNVSPDLSVLRKPVEISVPGLTQVIKALQTGTKEVQHILSYECDIIYECKVCRNLFRSLANFISHKRVYCSQLYSNVPHNTFRKEKGINDSTVIIHPEEVGSCSKETWVTNDAAGDKKGKKDKGKGGPFRITIKKDLTSIVEKLMEKNITQSVGELVNNAVSTSEQYETVQDDTVKSPDGREHTIHLETIENTSSGIFQTVTSGTAGPKQLIKSQNGFGLGWIRVLNKKKQLGWDGLRPKQVMDLQRILSETEAVLGPDGKVVQNGVHNTTPKPLGGGKKKDSGGSSKKGDSSVVTAPESAVELYCNLCKVPFSTYKTLNHHMKSFHMTFRRLYPCPCCKLPLSNSWSVFRHLLKVHRKTNDQVRRLRDQVMKKAYVTEVLQSGAQKLIAPVPGSKDAAQTSTSKLDPQEASKLESLENKAWMDQFEDEFDLQRCTGCGRRFERRAALAAHSQICHKRNTPTTPKSGSTPTPSAAEKANKASKKDEPSSTPVPAPPPLATVLQTKFNSLNPTPPLIHPAHLSQLEVKNETPSKRIEIQVRRDYGKGSMTPEYRARTPSLSRSDEGAVSIGKSDDGATSINSDVNGESSDTSIVQRNDRLVEQTKVEVSTHPPVQSSQTNVVPKVKKPLVSAKARFKGRRDIRNAVKLSQQQTRYPVRKSNSTAINGVAGLKKRFSPVKSESNVTEKPPSNSHPDDPSNGKLVRSSDVLGDDRMDSKRSKLPDSVTPAGSENENEEESKRAMFWQVKDANERKLAAMSNIKKLMCLTCKKKYRTLGNLRRHVAIHLGWCRFGCMACDFKCFAKYDCVNHALNAHLQPWEKHKAMAMIMDLQLEAGGSTDPLSSDSVADSADSETTTSDIVAISSPGKESSTDFTPCDKFVSSDDSSEGARVSPVETAIKMESDF